MPIGHPEKMTPYNTQMVTSIFKTAFTRFVTSSVLIYSVRCIIGFVIGYTLYTNIPQYEGYWTLLSILLVLTPEDKDARRLAIERMKANLIGSAVALVLFLLHKPNLGLIIVGVLSIILICYLFNLLNVARTAMATLIIVLIYEQEQTSWLGAVERFVCVVSGCLIGLGITLVTAWLLDHTRRILHIEAPDTNTPPGTV